MGEIVWRAKHLGRPPTPQGIPLETVRKGKLNKQLLQTTAHDSGGKLPQSIAILQVLKVGPKGFDQPNILDHQGLLRPHPMTTFCQGQRPNNLGKRAIENKVLLFRSKEFTAVRANRSKPRSINTQRSSQPFSKAFCANAYTITGVKRMARAGSSALVQLPWSLQPPTRCFFAAGMKCPIPLRQSEAKAFGSPLCHKYSTNSQTLGVQSRKALWIPIPMQL